MCAVRVLVPVQRGLKESVSRVGVRPSAEEGFNHLAVAEPGSPVKRGVAARVALAHVSAVCQQQLHRPAVALLSDGCSVSWISVTTTAAKGDRP
jgi:hypothetical protein